MADSRSDVEALEKALDVWTNGPLHPGKEALRAKDALTRLSERLEAVERERDEAFSGKEEAVDRAEAAETRVEQLAAALREIATMKSTTRSYGDYKDSFLVAREIARTALDPENLPASCPPNSEDSSSIRKP